MNWLQKLSYKYQCDQILIAIVWWEHLGDEEGSHARAGAAAQGVGELETLQAVAALRLLPHHVQDRVDQLGSCKKAALSCWNKVVITAMLKLQLASIDLWWGEEKSWKL